MARFQIPMRAAPAKARRHGRARRRIVEPGLTLLARLEELELRIKLLEARLRTLTAERPVPRRKAPVRSKRPRPRCPGCVLELPPGRRREECGWCGFRFEAVGGPRRRQATR